MLNALADGGFAPTQLHELQKAYLEARNYENEATFDAGVWNCCVELSVWTSLNVGADNKKKCKA
jgi:hypothetical protein